MSRPRMSVAGLMATVLSLAVGFAALRNATETWAGVMLPATLGLLAASILGIVYRIDGRRAWWMRFALFGWGYAALTLSPWSKPESLATHVFLGYLNERITPSREVAMDSFTLSAGVRAAEFVILDSDIPQNALLKANASGQVVRIGSPHQRSFQAIGHCMFTLLVAVVGAIAARWFRATRGAGVREST